MRARGEYERVGREEREGRYGVIILYLKNRWEKRFSQAREELNSHTEPMGGVSPVEGLHSVKVAMAVHA